MTLRQHASCLGINDFTIGIIDGNLFALFLLVGHIGHLVQCQLVDMLVLINLQTLLDFAFHLVGIEQLVDQFHAHQFLLAAKCYIAVSISVQ